MVTHVPRSPLQNRSFALIELITAIGVLAVAMIPLVGALAMDRTQVRAQYGRAAAEQVLDGYREVLAAGAWQHYRPGTYHPRINSRALNELPDSSVVLHVSEHGDRLRFKLSWDPQHLQGVRAVHKTFSVPRSQPSSPSAGSGGHSAENHSVDQGGSER